MKISKPRIKYDRTSELYYCHLPLDKENNWVYVVGAGHTPEEAFWDWMKHKVEGWGRTIQPYPRAHLNITYIDPKDMLPEWCSMTTYSSGNMVKCKGNIYTLRYLKGKYIFSVNDIPSENFPMWKLLSESGDDYMVYSGVTELPARPFFKHKRWWEVWK